MGDGGRLGAAGLVEPEELQVCDAGRLLAPAPGATDRLRRAALILEAEGLAHCAKVLTEWPELEPLAQRLLRDPLSWVLHWEPLIAAAYAEVRPYLRGK